MTHAERPDTLPAEYERQLQEAHLCSLWLVRVSNVTRGEAGQPLRRARPHAWSWSTLRESRAPFVMPKADTAFSRNYAVNDTTSGWRFVNKLMKEQYGTDSMPETAENVAIEYEIEREAQDRMALASQQKAVAAQKSGFVAKEITPVTIPQKKGEAVVVDKDEPR